ncbi:hypothetical protein ACFW04_009198 [Cataglyphis niger]
MITQTKDLTKDTVGDMSTYERPSDTHHLTTMTRIVGVCTAVVVCGVGADVAYHRHVMGLYIRFAAGLLAVLSLLHIASSALGRRDPCQSNAGTDSVGESLLNSRQDNYDRFEEVLVTEVLDDGVSGSGRCPGDSDGEI